MKQEEFDWLKLWISEVVWGSEPEFKTAEIVFKRATGKYPPPIDEEEPPHGLYCPHCQDKHRITNVICPMCGKDITKPSIDEEKVPRQERKEGDPCGFPTQNFISVPCKRPLKRCSCGVLDCDDPHHSGHAHPIEPKPDLKVGIAGAHCNTHDTDFISKDDHFYCPGCFPEGFADIDKRDLKFFAACKNNLDANYVSFGTHKCPDCDGEIPLMMEKCWECYFKGLEASK